MGALVSFNKHLYKNPGQDLDPDHWHVYKEQLRHLHTTIDTVSKEKSLKTLDYLNEL